MKKALIVGIDDYHHTPLKTCVNDAQVVSRSLERNEDGSPNFSIKALTNAEGRVDRLDLSRSLQQLFSGTADTVLFYFAGHGIINPETNAGYLVTQDGEAGNWGLSLTELLSLANRAYPNIKSTVIILDCCQSGQMGEPIALGTEPVSFVGSGVTIMTATERDQTATSGHEHGVFTTALLDALDGAAADILGRITPASVYGHIDQTLGPWDQRPVYKANNREFITLRETAPKVPREVLRKLTSYFPEGGATLALDPSFEPTNTEASEANTAIFADLQLCNRHGLVKPVEAEHMYFAAMDRKSCALTPLGQHYRKLAAAGRL